MIRESPIFISQTWFAYNIGKVIRDKEYKPTPVSSLLHAATLVTAGVYLLIRSSPLLEFSPTTLFFITVMGALTTLFAATSGMLQNDLKRIIAFSTISQLGYIFIAIGLN